MTDHIYSYYAEVGCAGQRELIALWLERWKKEGWTPIVLGEADTRKDPRYDAMQVKARNFPCLHGSKGFERCNFERWLAFSQIPQPSAVVADYDVFALCPCGPMEDDYGFICADGAGGPGFIIGSPSDFSKIADDILAYDVKPDDQWDGKPHFCDMRLLHKSKERYDEITHTLKCYGVNGWLDVPLVHFGNAYVEKEMKTMTKAQACRGVLDRYYHN